MRNSKKLVLFLVYLGLLIALTVNSSDIKNNAYNRELKNVDSEHEKERETLKNNDWDLPIYETVDKSPFGVFIEDVNNDGYNDIITCSVADSTVSILIWNSTTNDWDPQISISVGFRPYDVFIADANNDGYNDIVTANRYEHTVSILIWNSTAVDWDPQISREVGRRPYKVFIADANNDGYNDIVTPNYDDNNVSILLWNSTAVDWDPQIKRTVRNKPCDLYIADANNDGYNDIATAHYYDDTISILLWNSTIGDWDSKISITVAWQAHYIFIADANNDEYNDIATANYDDETISIILWNDTISDWDPPFKITLYGRPNNLFIKDINNDGYNDIATTVGYRVLILLWNTFTNDWDRPLMRGPDGKGGSPANIHIEDANNDGYNDIVVSMWGVFMGDDYVSILLWNPIPHFWEIETIKLIGEAFHSIFIADANNDGYNDIVTVNYDDSNKIRILLWNSTIENWDSEINKSVAHEVFAIFINDANNDGFNDIVTLNFDRTVSILLWNSTINNWNPEITKIIGSSGYPLEIFVEDANNDGYKDILTLCDYEDHVSIFLWNDTLNDWDDPIKLYLGRFPQDFFVADANNDGYNDIVSIPEYYPISILLWNATINDWDPPLEIGSIGIKNVLFIKDANNDGYNDIITMNNEGQVSIFLWNSTDSNWDSPILKFMGNKGARGWDLFVADANNDGYNDIVTILSRDVVFSILFWNSTSFDWDIQRIITAPDDPIDLFVADANNDGSNDIISSNWYGSITLLLWKDISPPIIKINEPDENDLFGKRAPYFDVEIFDDSDIDEMWYTLDEGLHNFTFINNEMINQDLWDLCGNGTVMIKFYANDTIGHLGFSEVTVRKDIYKPQLSIDSPLPNQLYGDESPSFDITIDEPNLDTTWYTLDGGLTNHTFVGLTGTIEQSIWALMKNGTVTIRFYANDTAGNLGFAEVTVRKDIIGPEIAIKSPSFNDLFGTTSPTFNVEISDIHGVDTMWYTLDGGLINITFISNGSIYEMAWALQDNGTVTIEFYANDTLGNIGYAKVMVRKDIIAPKIVIYEPILNMEFDFPPEYNISIEEANLDSIWYTIDGGLTNITITNLVGTISENIWYTAPDGPICIDFYAKDLLGNEGYEYIHVMKKVVKTVYIDIVLQRFTSEVFNITFSVTDMNGYGIDFATIQMWWDGNDVSNNVQNLEGGLYFVSLTPISVGPGEEPIMLNMTVSAFGYVDKYFETYIAVEIAKPVISATVDFDPDTLDLKSEGKWVTVYIELPDGYDVSDIDIGSILLNGALSRAEFSPIEIGDYDNDGISDLMVKFSRKDVQDILEPGENVEITISGELVDDTKFVGSDTIKVIKLPSDDDDDDDDGDSQVSSEAIPFLLNNAISLTSIISILSTTLYIKRKNLKNLIASKKR